MFKVKDINPGAVDDPNDIELKHLYSKEHPVVGIKTPGLNDVLFGRGGATNLYCGNKRFRELVDTNKPMYNESKRLDKPRVAMMIVNKWREQEPPGRFLKQINNGTNGDVEWNEVGDTKAREKTSQALREKEKCSIVYKKGKNGISKKERSQRRVSLVDSSVEITSSNRPMKSKRETSHEIQPLKSDKRPTGLTHFEHSLVLNELPGGRLYSDTNVLFDQSCFDKVDFTLAADNIDKISYDSSSATVSKTRDNNNIDYESLKIENGVVEDSASKLGLELCDKNDATKFSSDEFECLDFDDNLDSLPEIVCESIIDEVETNIDDNLNELVDYPLINENLAENDTTKTHILSNQKPRMLEVNGRESTFPIGSYIPPQKGILHDDNENNITENDIVILRDKPQSLIDENRETTFPTGCFMPPDSNNLLSKTSLLKPIDTSHSPTENRNATFPGGTFTPPKPSFVNRETSLCSIASELSVEFSALELNPNQDQAKLEQKEHCASRSSVHQKDLSQTEEEKGEIYEVPPLKVNQSRSISHPSTTFLPPGRTVTGEILRQMLREQSR